MSKHVCDLLELACVAMLLILSYVVSVVWLTVGVLMPSHRLRAGRWSV